MENFLGSYHELMNYSSIIYRLRGVISLYKSITKQEKLEDIIVVLNKEIPCLFNCYKVFYFYFK